MSKELNLLQVSVSIVIGPIGRSTYSGSPGKIWPARSLIKSARSSARWSTSRHGIALPVGRLSMIGAGSGPSNIV